MKNYKILIVDDDPMVAMINEQYVRKNKGFEVAGTCKNGQEVLDFLAQNEVDLIVLDVYMPILDGVATLKKIRELKIPVEVIMLTAANDSSTIEETMHLGVLDYLIKPFTFERFQVALEKFSSQVAVLKQNPTLDQKSIDSIITNTPNSRKSSDYKFPKGIQSKTLDLVLDYLCSNSGWQTSDVISEKLGLSIVTIRHYMTYLEKEGKVQGAVNYETGGRPCMLYKLKI